MTPPTLLLLYPGAILHEVSLATDLLGEVEVATPDGAPFRDGCGLRVQADLAYAAVEAARYRAVLVPGGDPGEVIEDEQLHRCLREAHAAGAVVGGICAGALVLAAAGLLAGRRATHNYRAPWASPEIAQAVARFWEGAEIDPDPQALLASDERVITALPNGAIDFALAVALSAGALEAEQATFLARYHRGQAGPGEAAGPPTRQPRPEWSPVPHEGCAGVAARVLLHEPGLALANLRFEPGGTIHEHAAPHPIDVLVLEGEGRASVGETVHPLRAGDALRWPAGVPHRLWSEGAELRTLMVERLGAELR